MIRSVVGGLTKKAAKAVSGDSGNSLSRYWNPLKPLGGETPSFWIKPNSRNALTLVDSVNSPTNDISILPSHITTTGVSAYGYINDNGALDIYDHDLTLCGWYNDLMDKSAVRQVFGKQVAGSANGRYGIYINQTTGYYAAIIQSSGNTYTITSTIDASTCGAAFLLMDVNLATSKFRFFIWTAATGFNQIGTDTAFTGTFNHLSNSYRFYIGAANTATTGVATGITQSEWADVRVVDRILTPTEQTTLLNRGSATNPKAYFPCNNEYLYDSSGNNYHLTPYAITYTQVKYSTMGSRQGLDAGYTRYTLYGNKEIQIPYTHTSTPCAAAPVGYTKDADIPTDTLNHNGADSYLVPIAGTMDRSSSTTCTYMASLATYGHYYKATLKNGLHSSEATNYNLLNYFKPDYKGKNFIKRNGRIITDWVNYNTNKTGSDYTKAITWTGENINHIFGSGSFLSMGMDTTYSIPPATNLYLGKAISSSGAFVPAAAINYTDAPTTGRGNPKVLPLNVNKCNGTTPVAEGEINWLMTHEVIIGSPLYVAKSHNGVDWNFITTLPAATPTIAGQSDFFIDNNDPSDYHNIHVISFRPNTGTFHETHPLNANFTEWSDFVTIFDSGIINVYNCTVLLIGSTYHMFYSTEYDGHHYMYHATCTYGAMTAANDWHNVQTGNWSGLGDIESFSFVNTGGSNWTLYYYDLTAGNYKYSLSTDDCATWSAGTVIPSLSTPLQFSVGIIKLQ